VGPIGDVADGPKLARDASDVLLRFAAYDYGLAGTLAGEKTRLVDIDRYASAARQAVRSIDTSVGINVPCMSSLNFCTLALCSASFFRLYSTCSLA